MKSPRSGKRKKSIPFTDLARATGLVSRAYLARVKKFLERGLFVLSPEVEEFESALSKYVGSPHVVGVSNGADAIYLALTALGVGAGDEIITQGNAYNASVTAILRTGARARFADIEERTLTVRPEAVEQLITSKTKAILPVHLYGAVGDMQAIMDIARRHNLAVVEDAAQAHGATYRGRHAGTWGDVGAFSFYPTKNLGAFGDAGAVVTNRADIAEKIRSIRNLGQSEKNVHDHLGFNMRLDPIQAIALSLKLKILSREIALRRKAAELYLKHFEKAGLASLIPHALPESAHSYHLFVIVLPRGSSRDGFQNALRAEGIETAVHYPEVVYNQPFWKNLRLPFDVCPVAEDIAKRIVSLPFYPTLPEGDAKRVALAVATFLK
ncbi:MAG: pyridoxal phosphate-dependent protein [Parcubacteria group bacterium Gr01-1014_72]|nr:MAG: pyridoxal phosphate-dependent protein [Parcubacteria group bacterium Gr01-1014_72]